MTAAKDIVERLRDAVGWEAAALTGEAADAIESLRAERDAAREALEECESVLRRIGCDMTADIARAALIRSLKA